MSEPPSISRTIVPAASATATAPVRTAIARAARATGVDFSYLLAQAKLESSLDPSAKAPTSSAAGLYQFTNGTWLQTLGRHGAEHGLDWAGAVVNNGRIADPSVRAQVMALRYDPGVSALMAGELAADNRAELATALGREPDAAELYLGHFLGIGGARTFLSALATEPDRSAASLMPQAAAANRTIFYDADGPRSVAGVMQLIRSKMSAAMEGEGAEVWTALASTPSGSAGPAQGFAAAPQQGAIAREFRSAQAQMPKVAARSMAETLNASFGSSPSSAPAHVRDAYAKLARFGL